MAAKPIRWTALLVVVLLAAPAAAGAECVTVQLPKGERRKATTLVVAGSLEGATVKSFETGKAYLVRYFGDPQPFPVVEPDFPAGTLSVAFSCGDGPVLLAESGAELKRLGRGRAPLP